MASNLTSLVIDGNLKFLEMHEKYFGDLNLYRLLELAVDFGKGWIVKFALEKAAERGLDLHANYDSCLREAVLSRDIKYLEYYQKNIKPLNRAFILGWAVEYRSGEVIEFLGEGITELCAEAAGNSNLSAGTVDFLKSVKDTKKKK